MRLSQLILASCVATTAVGAPAVAVIAKVAFPDLWQSPSPQRYKRVAAIKATMAGPSLQFGHAPNGQANSGREGGQALWLAASGPSGNTTAHLGIAALPGTAGARNDSKAEADGKRRLERSLSAQDQWPDFRGPAGDGHSRGHSIPLEWSETRNVRWKIPIAGRAWSSAVVWGNQIWLTTAPPDGHEMSAMCVELSTGKVLMDRVIFRNAELEVQGPGHDSNSYASPSPVIEEGRVYLHYGKYGTACLDTRTFKTLWERRDLLCTHSAGPGSSPVLYRDRLYLTYDGIDVQFLAALDSKTGKTIWKTPRTVDWSKLTPPANTDVQQRKAFATPFVTTWEGKPLLISSGAKATYGYDGDTGRELWKVTFPGFSNAARPIAEAGVAYINTGYPRADLWAVRLGGSGDVTATHVLWRLTKNVPLNPSPLLVDGLLYLINGGGILTCVDARTGEPVWSERLQGPFSASPVLIEGRIYLFNEHGRCTVLQPGREFKKLAENDLDDGLMGSPAVVGDRLVLRAKNRLYLIQASGP